MASSNVEQMEEQPGTSSASTPTAATSNKPFEINNHPVCLIVLGMAGSGKTQFVKKLSQVSHIEHAKPYVINLDPACKEVPYHASIGKQMDLTISEILELNSFNF